MEKKECFITLSGGIAYSAYHIGVLERILKNYNPKVVSATNTSAVIALLFILGKYDALEQVYYEFCSIKNTIQKNESLFFKFLKTIFFGETFSSNRLFEVLQEHFTQQDFDVLQAKDIEFIVEGTNIYNYSRVSFSSKRFANLLNGYDEFCKRIIICSSIPFLSEAHGIYNDGIRQTEWFLDAFVSDFVPVAAVYEKKRKPTPHFVVGCNPQVKIANSNKKISFLELIKKTIGHLFYTIETLKIKKGFQSHWNRDLFFIIKNKTLFFQNAIDTDAKQYRDAVQGGYTDADKILQAKGLK